MKAILFTLIIILFNCQLLTSQNNNYSTIDSLLTKSYDELEQKFYENEYDNLEKARYYADTFLKKGKQENDSIQIARGYKLISYLYIDSENIPLILRYCDSIIHISKNNKHRSYPAYGYYQKGVWLFEKGDYKGSLDNYLIAKKFAAERNNENQLNNIKLAVAALKDRYGEYEESIILYNEYLDYILKIENFKKDHPQIYLSGIYNVANGYLRLRRIDSADVYINKGLEESKILNDSSSYYDFLSSLGTSLYFKKDFQKSLSTLNKVIPFKDNYGLAICYYYKAECHKSLGDIDKSIVFYKKSDSIYLNTNSVFPELRRVYENLIDDAKSKKNIENQLFYIEKLLKTDSILDIDFKYISKNIIKKYDTTILIEDKQLIIKKLSNKGKIFYRIIIGLLIFTTFLTIAFVAYTKYKNRLNKKRFDELVKMESSNKNNAISKNTLVEKNDPVKISDDVADILLKKLHRFEKEKLFLEQGITLNKIAELIQTNSSYLSKVVNTHMKKSFNTYINDLRIEYVIIKLKEDSKFRKYAIKSIAEEIGYANSQSFSNAFYKKTGIKPSYFIKQLNA